ncbi:hypothetical protein N2152v2_007355 [Parachlorella kessleri]
MLEKEKKEFVREKKAKRQKNFGLIQEVVGLWEELRRHDVSADKRSKLISAVLRKVQGRVAELAASHTASRVIQACVKHGSAQERAAILKEVEPKLLDLSKSPYGHFVVSKLISLAPKEQLPGILKQFRGQAPALLRHPAGAHVIDDLWAVADSRQRNAMAAEFYGREYSLFEGGTINGVAGGAPAHLPDLLAAVDGAKRRAVIQNLAREVVPLIEKGLVDPPLAHRLVAEFLECCPASLVADAVESLCGEPLLHMVHTKEGARAACMALAYATAKERKKAVRAFKGHVATMARDEWGHLVLITALSVVDDTALLKKFIVGDLQKDLQDLCAHHYGHRVLLQLLHPYCPRYLPPQLLAIVRPPQKVYALLGGGAGGDGAAAAAGEGEQEGDGGAAGTAGEAGKGGQQEAAAAGRAESDDEDDGEGGGGSRPASGPLGVSKKDDSTRRRELLGAGASGLGGALAALCVSHADELLRSQYGCDVVVEACRGGEGGLLAECAGEAAVTALHRAVAAAVASSAQGPQQQEQQQQQQEGGGGKGASEGEDEGSRGAQQAQQQQEPLLEQYFASRALRRLVLSSAPQAGQSGVDAVQSPATRCVELLWAEGGLRGRCERWVGGHAAKVLAALVRCGSGAVRVAAAEELAPLVAPQGVEEWAERFAAAPQAAAAAAAAGGRKGGGKRKSKAGSGRQQQQPQQGGRQQQGEHRNGKQEQQTGKQEQPQKEPQQTPAKQTTKRQKKAKQ